MNKSSLEAATAEPCPGPSLPAVCPLNLGATPAGGDGGCEMMLNDVKYLCYHPRLPLPSKTQPGLCNLRTGLPHLLFTPPPPGPSGSNSGQERDPKSTRPHPIFAVRRQDLAAGVSPRLGTAFERGEASTCISVAPAGTGKGRFVPWREAGRACRRLARREVFPGGAGIRCLRLC